MVQVDTFTEYRPLLFSIAYRMLGSVMDAEDVVRRLEHALGLLAQGSEEVMDHDLVDEVAPEPLVGPDSLGLSALRFAGHRRPRGAARRGAGRR